MLTYGEQSHDSQWARLSTIWMLLARTMILAWEQSMETHVHVGTLSLGVQYMYVHCTIVTHLTCTISVCHYKHPPPPSPPASLSLGASRERLTLQWLRECEQLFSSLVSDHPVLYYHLSLIHALSGTKEASRTAWRSFINE